MFERDDPHVGRPALIVLKLLGVSSDLFKTAELFDFYLGQDGG